MLYFYLENTVFFWPIFHDRYNNLELWNRICFFSLDEELPQASTPGTS